MFDDKDCEEFTGIKFHSHDGEAEGEFLKSFIDGVATTTCAGKKVYIEAISNLGCIVYEYIKKNPEDEFLSVSARKFVPWHLMGVIAF